jgi:predicted RND superfamily exporter protein
LIDMAAKLHKTTAALLVAINLCLVGAFVATVDLSRVLNNAIDIWFDVSDPTLPAYRAEQESFGESSWVYVNLWAESPAAAENASATLTDGFRDLEGTVSVLSPHDIDVLQEDSEGLFFDVLASDISWAERHEILSVHPLASTALASAEDPTRVGFLLEEATGVGSGGFLRQQLLSDIRSLIDATPGVREYAVTGSAVINAELNRLSWRDILILLPVTGTLVMGLGLVLLRRNVMAFAAIMGVVTLVMTSGMAAMLVAGQPFNMVTIALPGILFTLGIASGLHVCQYVAENRDRPVSELTKGLFRPLFVSHVTTALGFGLLAMITVLPVQSMALWGALGGLWSGRHMAVLLPALLLKTKGALHLPKFGVAHWVPRLISMTEQVARRKNAPWMAFAVLAFVMAAGVARLTFDSTYLNMVSADQQMRHDYDLLAERGVPSAQLNIVLETGATDGTVAPEINDLLAALALDLGALEGVRKVLGAPQIYTEAASKLRQGQAPEIYDADTLSVTDTYVFALTGGNREVGRYLEYDLETFRLVVMFDYMPNSRLRALVQDQIRPLLSTHVAKVDGVSAEVSGLAILWANMDDAIAAGQVKSLSILAMICFGLFLLSYKSWRIAAVATFVNLMPVAIIAATLGFLGLPIDMAAIFILSLLLGIATDDTSFYINSYVQKRKYGQGLNAVLTEVAPAMLMTSVLITLGFLVLLMSSFVPIQTFGVFTALGIVCATLADIVLLTFLLVSFQSKGLVYE